MTPKQETFEDARNRLHDLDHAVAEAEAAVDRAPTDTALIQKRDMAVSIRDEAKKAVIEAEARLVRSRSRPDDDA